MNQDPPTWIDKCGLIKLPPGTSSIVETHFLPCKKITRTGPENRTDARGVRLGDVFPMGWLPVF
jgi:hypothetical protein